MEASSDTSANPQSTPSIPVSSSGSPPAFVSLTPAPAQRLPFELLSMIFILCAFGFGEAPDILFDRNAFPWPLAQVCRLWRTAAFGEPMLWASLHISFARVVSVVDAQVFSKWYLERLSCVLQRSKNRALAIRMSDPVDEQCFVLQEFRAARAMLVVPVLHMLRDHAQRVTKLAMPPVHCNLGTFWSGDGAVEWRDLTELTFPDHHGSSFSADFTHSSKLRNLSFTSLNQLVREGLPWERITHVTLAERSLKVVAASDIVHIFAYARRTLVSFELLYKAARSSFEKAMPLTRRVEFPALQNLVLRSEPDVFNSGITEAILDLMCCPLLESLEVTHCSLASIMFFIKASNPSASDIGLRRLVLGDRVYEDNPNLIPGDAATLLRSLNNLQHLSVHWGIFKGDCLLSGLVDGSVCPHLRELILYLTLEVTLPTELVKRYVLGRLANGCFVSLVIRALCQSVTTGNVQSSDRRQALERELQEFLQSLSGQGGISVQRAPGNRA